VAFPKGDPANVIDEPKGSSRDPGPETPEDLGADFLKGYVASTPESADYAEYPGNQVWQPNGGSAITYKAHWKNKPKIFPYGTNDEGGK